MAIVNADIYNISEFMNDIKKQYNGIEEDTLFMGMFGYTNEVLSNMLQQAVIMAAEYSNEGIPVKAKFEKNIITHALTMDITNINATPASMTVLMGFLESELVKNMKNDRFVYDKDYKIFVEDFEFHTEYDIIINRNLLPNGDYTYTAQYDISRKNPVSRVENPYLTPPVRVNVDNDIFIFVECTIRQYEQNIIYKKILTDNLLENKTTNFDFEDGQLADFSIKVTEGPNTLYLVPMYEGLYKNTRDLYFYYSYIDSNNIRIKFDRDVYAPRINADVEIDLKTTQGAKGNFTYKDELVYNISSERLKYSNMTMSIKPITDSENGENKKSVDELKKMIPKEALSRGSVTNTTDLENFFNMISTEYSKLYFYKKRDNQIERVYYSYLLMKDMDNVIVPTNTITILADAPNFANTENNKFVLEPGNLIYYNNSENPYGIIGGSGLVPPEIDAITLDEQDPEEIESSQKSTYTMKMYGFDKLTVAHPTEVILQVDADNVMERGGYPNTVLKFYVLTPTDGKISMIATDPTGKKFDVVEQGYFGDGEPAPLSHNYSNTFIFETSCTQDGIYTVMAAIVDTDTNKVISQETVYLNIGGFIYTSPFMCVINKSPLYVSYYLNIINMTKYLGFEYINQFCKLQFISTYATWKREYLHDRDTYYLDIPILQNINNDEGLIIKDADGNITQQNIRVFLILFRDSIPYRYAEAELTDYDDSAFAYNFRFNFKTKDIINQDNLIRIENLYDIGTINESYGYLESNTKATIYILSKQDLQYGRDDTDGFIPNMEGYTLSNKYSLKNGLDFFFDYSEVITSNISPLKGEDGSLSFKLYEVPVVKQAYVDDDAKIENFIYQVEKRKNYIDYSLSILEDSFGIDLKFFNTYGPSNLFYLDEAYEHNVDRTNLTLRFRMKIVTNADKHIKEYVQADIKAYIEDLNEIKDLHIPNLITYITNKYREQLVYFEFLSINDNGPGKQHIYQKELDYYVGITPEFLNVNTLDNGEPDIDITVV